MVPQYPLILYIGSSLLFPICSVAEDSTAKGMDRVIKKVEVKDEEELQLRRMFDKVQSN